jgi:outer membrane autotransporter protein
VTTIQATSDNDLGVPGAAVTLNSTLLRTLASFTTPRNFNIGSGGSIIDTNGNNLSITGVLNAQGMLIKDGLGTLTLTGNNVWTPQPWVANGVLEGNASSLQTSIFNNGTVRFNQAVDGSYSGIIAKSNVVVGWETMVTADVAPPFEPFSELLPADGTTSVPVTNPATTSVTPAANLPPPPAAANPVGNFEKTGPGRLTLTNAQSYGGTTSILGGTLALSDSGELGNTTALNISSGATFDISRAQKITHAVGLLSGGGNVLLGSNNVSTGGAGDSTFAGSISGIGGLSKTGDGTLTLSGVNSYTGATRVEGGTLALEGAGRLSASSAVLISQGTFDIARADGAREVGSIGGAGRIRLGANTLTVGADNSSNIYGGVISGSGGLTKTGSGSLTLTGANTYTGITTINQGDLIARAQSISASVINNAALTLTEDGSAANAIYAGTISGNGKLNKTGSGTVTLTGVNTYTGATTITDGTLALAGQGRLNAASSLGLLGGTFDIADSAGNQEVGSLEGRGSIQLGANTLTVGRNNTSNPFEGSILGSGGLTKTGAGNLTLSGFNNFSGTTTINQGNLTAMVYSISENVVNNATLTLTEFKSDFKLLNPLPSVYSGNISGSGQLIKDSEGVIWLRGRNTYTGGTTVKSGYLIGNTDSLQGNITNNAGLAFYQVDNGTYAGTLSGSGTLLQYGPGVLTLTGTNTYTGSTAFSGTLRIDRDANLGAASGALVMAGGTLRIGADMTTARDIALAPEGGTVDTNGFSLVANGRITTIEGALTKIGAGTLVMNSPGNAVKTTVDGGRLENNGSLLTTVIVNAGAEFGGTGVIVGEVVNHGRWSRGTSTGPMQVVGDVRFEPGSIFTVKADASGKSDQIVAKTFTEFTTPVGIRTTSVSYSANATLNGGTVDVRAENGNYRRQTRYNILTAESGITGQFSGVTSNLAFLTPNLAYDTNNVYLTLTRNDKNYAAVAQNPNQTAVAESLARVSTVATGDAVTVANAIDGLSAAQARAAFNSIGAAGLTAVRQVGAVNMRTVSQNLIARLGEVESSNALATAAGIAGRVVQVAFDAGTRTDAAPVYAQAGMPAGGQGLRMAADTNNGFWLRGYGGTGRLDGDASAPGAKYHYGGTLFGYDRKIGNAVTLGVFGGYAEPRYSQDVATSSARAKTYQIGGYGRLLSGAWHVDAVASYARNNTDTSRVVSAGALNRVASGSFKGDTVSVHVETGYTIKTTNVEIQPLAALSWVRQTQNAYSETGAGALNLVLPEQSQQSLRSSIGLRTLHPFQAGATQAVFETRAAWSHEFNNTRSINARLAGDPAAAVFTVSGPSLPRDSVVVGVGIAAQASRNLRLYADLNGEFNGRVRAGALSVGLRYQW